MGYTYDSEIPIRTVGDLHQRLIADMTVIKNICENSNPTYRTRVQQILAVVTRLEQDLTEFGGGTTEGQRSEKK